jgi:hypothetical protein
MDVEQDKIISVPSTTSGLHATGSTASSTSESYDLAVQLSSSSTEGRTTAAIVPSLTLSGVDVVIYEVVNNKQLCSLYFYSST